ncbi:MAG TPA: phosphoribosyl-AMP cyclohydrolase [Microbacteriaceae bacterium]|nr:phosphoribosyl-AMP cyclohydrolase [Microbacteriaceae bacterium]
MIHSTQFDADVVRFDDAGLVAAVIQSSETGEVLMVGYMNAEALRRTMTEGRVTFWSRSRQEFWRKGDTSGNAQYVQSISADCDGDAVLVRVLQIGPACHTGAQSCFDTHPLMAKVATPGEDAR